MRNVYRMVWERSTKHKAVYSDVDGRLQTVYIPLLEFNGERPPPQLWITVDDTPPTATKASRNA